MLIALLLSLTSSELLFDKDVAGKKTEVSWMIEEKDNLIQIVGEANKKKTQLFCDVNFYINKYFSDESLDGDTFSVLKEDHTLVAKKVTQGAESAKSYNIEGKNWVQDFSFGLKPYFMSDQSEYKFEIINPKDLIMRTMVAMKEEIDMKTFNGVEYRARRVMVTLDGFYRKFWRAELWYDTKTFNLLYYKANEGPGTPYTILTIKEIKQ